MGHWRYFLNPSESNSCAALSDVICVWTVLPLPRVTFISGSKNSWWVNILNLKPQQSWQVLSGTEKLYHPPHLTPHTSPSRRSLYKLNDLFLTWWEPDSLTETIQKYLGSVWQSAVWQECLGWLDVWRSHPGQTPHTGQGGRVCVVNLLLNNYTSFTPL